MDMRSMEFQMDGLYSLLLARHMEVITAIYNDKDKRNQDVLKNIASCMAAACDSLQHCSEEFAMLRETQPDMTGMPIVYDGPMGESFNPLQD